MLSHSRYGEGVPPWFKEFANFCGVSVLTMAINIPPPAYKVPKILTMDVCEPSPAYTWPQPISTVLLVQFQGQPSFHLRTKLELQNIDSRSHFSCLCHLYSFSFSRNKGSRHVSSSAGHSTHTVQKECAGSNLGSLNHYSTPLSSCWPHPWEASFPGYVFLPGMGCIATPPIVSKSCHCTELKHTSLTEICLERQA